MDSVMKRLMGAMPLPPQNFWARTAHAAKEHISSILQKSNKARTVSTANLLNLRDYSFSCRRPTSFKTGPLMIDYRVVDKK